MEERKLNFNAPLLSVRRSSARTSPSNAKRIVNSQRGRLLNLASCKADSSLDQVTEPVAVPFHWEQIPGTRKNTNIPDPYHHQEASVAPQFSLNVKPEYQDVFRSQVEASPSYGALDCSEEGVNDKAVIDSENDDDVYSVALDTLSGIGSFFGHCSVSGVSGFGDLAIVKHSGTFATDPQIRDLMMSLFLPAAKAMTLEQPHYSSRNKPVSGEQPRQITKVVQRNRKPAVVRNGSQNMVPYHHQDIEDEQTEDGGDEYTHSVNITTKGCGLLPRLCIKNSLCLLNPVPGMKVRTQNAVRGMKMRTQNSMPTSRDTHGAKNIKKAAFARSQSPTIKRPTQDAIKPKLENDVRSPRLSGTFTSDREMISRSSPFRRSGVISPYCNEAPQSTFSGPQFLGAPEEHENLKNNKWSFNNKVYSKSHELVVPYHAIRLGSRPVSSAVEKTLYVDTINVAKTSTGAAANNVNIASDQILDEDHTENAKTSLVVCPLPPLLPRTPSESWLWRTLPSISSQNSFYRGTSFQIKRQNPNISSSDTKWENIVKSSYLHHDHVRYSEELFPHASQQSKS